MSIQIYHNNREVLGQKGQADDSHVMPRLIFLKKKKRNLSIGTVSWIAFLRDFK